jgi:hypothetical protein
MIIGGRARGDEYTDQWSSYRVFDFRFLTGDGFKDYALGHGTAVPNGSPVHATLGGKKCVWIPAANNYLDWTAPFQMSFAQPWTIQWHAYTTLALVSGTEFIRLGNTPLPGYRVAYYTSTYRVSWAMREEASASSSGITLFNPTAGSWHHYCLCGDSTGSEMWIDSTLRGSTSASLGACGNTTIRIGTAFSGQDMYFARVVGLTGAKVRPTTKIFDYIAGT